MKTLLRSILLIVALLLLPGCAITHQYGPYMGKVVDRETGEPIAGAVVFLRFYTGTVWNPGGRNSNFADAVECLTDTQGEFNIPSQKFFIFHPGDTWDDAPEVIIFKPGYGAFPGHQGTTITHQRKEWFPANEYIAIQLPILNSIEDRLDNLGNAGGYDRNVPCQKQRLILKLYNSERASLKLPPIMTNICEDDSHDK